MEKQIDGFQFTRLVFLAKALQMQSHVSVQVLGIAIAAKVNEKLNDVEMRASVQSSRALVVPDVGVKGLHVDVQRVQEAHN